MTDKHKLLFYSDVYYPSYGGLTTSLVRILDGLVKTGLYDIHLLTYNEKKAQYPPEQTPFGATAHYFGTGETNIAYLYCQTALRKLISLHKTYHYDLFAAFYAHQPLLIVSNAAAALDVPYIVCARGSDINRNMTDVLHRKIMKQFLGDADTVICVSNDIASKIKKWKIGPRSKNIVVVSNSIKYQLFENYHSKKINSKPKYSFLFVGAARPVKRFDLIVSAMRILKKQGLCPSVAAVLLPHRQHAGLMEKYVIEAKRHKLATIHFLSPMFHEKMKHLYSESKCCIVPSDSEGFSNVVLEGMASGCYVIARDGLLASDLIGFKNRTFRTSSELAKHMKSIVNADEIFVKENFDIVKKRYKVSREINAYSDVIASAILRSKKP